MKCAAAAYEQTRAVRIAVERAGVRQRTEERRLEFRKTAARLMREEARLKLVIADMRGPK